MSFGLCDTNMQHCFLRMRHKHPDSRLELHWPKPAAHQEQISLACRAVGFQVVGLQVGVLAAKKEDQREEIPPVLAGHTGMSRGGLLPEFKDFLCLFALN